MLLSKEELVMIAKAFRSYRNELKDDDTDDLQEYNDVQVDNLNELANKLDLDEDYYRKE